MRSRLDLPAPLGPTRASAPPGARRNEILEKTGRSPRMQATSCASKQAAPGILHLSPVEPRRSGNA